jgi:hypothetical protein
MRGNPFQRLVAVMTAFIVLGLLVWQVTRTTSEAKSDGGLAAQEDRATTPPETYKIKIDFVHPPVGYKVLFLGKTLMEGKGPALNFSQDVDLPLPRQGLELVLESNWPEKTPLSAVRFRCEKNGDVITDRTFWGKRELTEVILVR